jgi:CopA family copper-resistance protein
MNSANPTSINRRQFVKGLAVTSISAALATHIPTAFANEEFVSKTLEPNKTKQSLLSGTEFNLTISKKMVNITGNSVPATLINGSLPAPTLVWREGDTITIHATNTMDVDASIHWHGIILPYTMDGVPGFSYPGIRPGETFTYQFTVQQNGTYWYHSHSGYQEQTGLYGAIVILPKKAQPIQFDHDYVIQLSDWSDTPPTTIYANLKKMGDYYNYHRRTVGDFWDEIRQKGLVKAWEARSMWGKMRMSDRDLSDVSGSTYTYLMNGVSPNAHWRAVVESGKKVRLRFVNSSSMTFFDVRVPGIKMTVIAADGNLIQPVKVDEFRIGVAETYDVIVEPNTSLRPYAIFAQAIDRSGYAIGSLTSSPTQLATIPKMDPLPILTMKDMGMSMSNMSGMDMGHQPMKSSEDMSGMKGMNMGHQSMKPSEDMSGMKGMNMDHQTMKSSEDMSGMKGMTNADSQVIPMNMNPKLPQMKVAQKFGPQTNMVATDPQYRLNDPGVGLRKNGRKVLTYADLKNLYPTRHEPKPTQELVLHLTGNMERYMWSINGIPFDEAKPLNFKYGERVRITFINDTMMNHPMHLHGLWSDLETGDENHIPRKHTIVVQPGSKISYRVTMNAMGEWPFHCHMLYHMMGMMRRVQVQA